MTLAFFAQSLIPAGYMPQFNTGKFFEIMICHGMDITTVLVDEHMQPVDNITDGDEKTKTSQHQYKSCLYSVMSSKNLVLPTFLYLQIEHLIYEQFVERRSPLISSILICTPYDGRAPPESFA